MVLSKKMVKRSILWCWLKHVYKNIEFYWSWIIINSFGVTYIPSLGVTRTCSINSDRRSGGFPSLRRQLDTFYFSFPRSQWNAYGTLPTQREGSFFLELKIENGEGAWSYLWFCLINFYKKKQMRMEFRKYFINRFAAAGQLVFSLASAKIMHGCNGHFFYIPSRV
jgi:hypothetical protein